MGILGNFGGNSNRIFDLGFGIGWKDNHPVIQFWILDFGFWIGRKETNHSIIQFWISD
jgi:hypothetical protein